MKASHRVQDLQPGDVVRVVRFVKGERAYRQRLLAMGVTPGVVFSVTRVAPLGDPVEISLRNYSMTLRRAEADILEIERI